MLYYLIALLPILVYLLIIKAMDGFSISSWNRLLSWVIWGAAFCGALFEFSVLTGRDLWWFAPFVEEFFKALPLLIAIRREKIAFFSECLIYGTSIGAGFAFVENIIYVSLLPDFSLGDALLRGFGTTILHMGCTALVSTLALVLMRVLWEKKNFAIVLAFILAVLPSFGIHFLYNCFLLPEFLQLVIVIIVMMALFKTIYHVDERLIHKWLDSCIANDITLLASIKEGKLRETPAGQYLMETRKKFNPEVFFDIITYLGLYLEMSISAKSRMIMKEAGFDQPLDPQTHEKNVSCLEELKALRKNIGLQGLMVLSPIINEKAVDSWVLDELL